MRAAALIRLSISTLVLSCAAGNLAAQRTAASVTRHVVCAGSANGHMLACDASTSAVLWDFDTARQYDAVNGVRAVGGAVEGIATALAGNNLFVTSGYASDGGGHGNALIAFSID